MRKQHTKIILLQAICTIPSEWFFTDVLSMHTTQIQKCRRGKSMKEQKRVVNSPVCVLKFGDSGFQYFPTYDLKVYELQSACSSVCKKEVISCPWNMWGNSLNSLITVSKSTNTSSHFTTGKTRRGHGREIWRCNVPATLRARETEWTWNSLEMNEGQMAGEGPIGMLCLLPGYIWSSGRPDMLHNRLDPIPANPRSHGREDELSFFSLGKWKKWAKQPNHQVWRQQLSSVFMSVPSDITFMPSVCLWSSTANCYD